MENIFFPPNYVDLDLDDLIRWKIALDCCEPSNKSKLYNDWIDARAQLSFRIKQILPPNLLIAVSNSYQL